MEDVKTIIHEARKMDDVDFELQKEILCNKLQNAFNVDFLIGENDRSKKERQFIALFLKKVEEEEEGSIVLLFYCWKKAEAEAKKEVDCYIVDWLMGWMVD